MTRSVNDIKRVKARTTSSNVKIERVCGCKVYQLDVRQKNEDKNKALAANSRQPVSMVIKRGSHLSFFFW